MRCTFVSSPRGIPQSQDKRDPTKRISYLEVQLQGLKAENTRMNRDMQSLISIITSRVFPHIEGGGLANNSSNNSSNTSPLPSANSPVSGRDRSRSSIAGDVDSSTSHSSRAEPGGDTEGNTPKLKQQQRLLRRLSAVVGRPQDAESVNSLSLENPGSYKGSFSVPSVGNFEPHHVQNNVTKLELDYALSSATETMLAKFYELEKRLEDFMAPVERLAQSDANFTPHKMFQADESANGTTGTTGAIESNSEQSSGIVAVDLAIRAQQHLAPFSSPAVAMDNSNGDVIGATADYSPEINLSDVHDLRDVIGKLSKMESDIAGLKVVLKRQLRIVDPLNATIDSDDEDIISVDVDLRPSDQDQIEQTPQSNNNQQQQQPYSSPARPSYHSVESYSNPPMNGSYNSTFPGVNAAYTGSPQSPMNKSHASNPQPTVNLSRALGSFLDVYHKCSISTEKVAYTNIE